MRYDKEGEELSPGLWFYRPGERVPPESSHAATPRSFEPGKHPLDDPPLPPRRQVGRRIIQGGPGEWGSY
jgi:hypothetical protein